MEQKLNKKGKSRKKLYLLGALALVLALTSSMFAYTYTTASVQIGAIADSEYAEVEPTTPPLQFPTRVWGKYRGDLPEGNLFSITPDGDYTGDLLTKVYLTNADELTGPYQHLNMILELQDADGNILNVDWTNEYRDARYAFGTSVTDFANAEADYWGPQLWEVGGDTATISTAEKHSGICSVELVSSGFDSDYAAVEILPPKGITIDDLDAATFGFYYMLTGGTNYYGPMMELRFTNPAGRGHVDITDTLLQTAQGGPITWTQLSIVSATNAIYFGNDPDGTAFWDNTGSATLASTKTALGTGGKGYGNWELTRVQVQVGWFYDASKSTTAYVDDININGVTYDLESAREDFKKATTDYEDETMDIADYLIAVDQYQKAIARFQTEIVTHQDKTARFEEVVSTYMDQAGNISTEAAQFITDIGTFNAALDTFNAAVDTFNGAKHDFRAGTITQTVFLSAVSTFDSDVGTFLTNVDTFQTATATFLSAVDGYLTAEHIISAGHTFQLLTLDNGVVTFDLQQSWGPGPYYIYLNGGGYTTNPHGNPLDWSSHVVEPLLYCEVTQR